jgi:hypothetical protein
MGQRAWERNGDIVWFVVNVQTNFVQAAKTTSAKVFAIGITIGSGVFPL